MKTSLPSVSVIIPTFNEEANLNACLQSVRVQRYPKNKIEIIVVDDYSTDNTVKVAKLFDSHIVFSGFKHIERSKSIGLSNSRGTLILFIDADIRLVGQNWLSTMVSSMHSDPLAVGAQAVQWHYSSEHTIVNRYCELFGINDPFVYMLGKRGVLSPIEKNWLYKETLISTSKDYFSVKFSQANLPTLGSQGFLVKRKILLNYSHWQPYFFHLDASHELVGRGYDRFVMVKREVEHLYVQSFFEYYKKLARNIELFLAFKKYRTYTYGIGSMRFLWTVVVMLTFVYPLIQSIKGFLKKHDVAWFVHPIVCFIVPILYAYGVCKWYVSLLWKRNSHI